MNMYAKREYKTQLHGNEFQDNQSKWAAVEFMLASLNSERLHLQSTIGSSVVKHGLRVGKKQAGGYRVNVLARAEEMSYFSI